MASPYRVYTIEPEIIKVFHKYVFGYPVEICANLKTTDKNIIIPHNILSGKEVEYSPGKFRGTCFYAEYSSNIFHSHPISSYAYPSVEDFVKVFKNYGKIVNSLIATKWGIWVISNTTTSNVYNTKDDEKLKKYIGVYLDRIGLSTKTSDEERKSKSDKSRDLVSDDYTLIYKTINKISTTLQIKIDLYSWSDIIDKGMVINGLTEI